jgi:hypothetical protein
VTLPIVDGALLVHARRAWTAKALAVGGYSPTLAAEDPFRSVPCTSEVYLPPSALDQPGGLDLGALVPVRVQVLDPTQRPVGGVRVACVAPMGLGYDVDGLAHATRGFSDGDGRVLLPAMPGRWFLVAEGAHAAAIAPIEVHPGLTVQRLQLQPLACMRVRVLDAAGAPVVGVRIENRGSLGADGEDAFLFMMLAQTVDFDGVVTDQSGHADLWFLPGRGNRPRYRIERDGRKAAGKVVAGDERVDIVLQ